MHTLPIPGQAESLFDRGTSQFTIFAGLLLGASLVTLDFFIVLACLPGMKSSLGASAGQLQLVVASYAIASACFLVIGGRIGDIYGRKTVYMVGVVLFAATSVGCASVATVEAVIAFRVLQGLAGALLQPQVMGLFAVNFTPSRLPRVFGIYAAALGCAAIFAQLIGGLLVQWLSDDMGWRACFLLSAPLCFFASYLARRAASGAPSRQGGLDAVGALLIAGALGATSAALSLGREQSWPDWSLVALGVGLLCTLALWWWVTAGHAKGAARIIPAGLIGRNAFTRACVAIPVFYAGVTSFYFVLALELRTVVNMTPMQTGLIFASMALFFVMASAAPFVKRRFALHWQSLGIGFLMIGHMLLLFSLGMTGMVRIVAILFAGALQGIGLGTLMGQLVARAISRLDQTQASIGSGVVATLQQAGNSLGVCAIGFAYFGSDQNTGSGMLAATVYLLVMLCILALTLRRLR